MLVPAALKQWAAEHNEQLSAETLAEVRTIADTIADSSLSGLSIADVGDDIGAQMAEVFPDTRADRATTLVEIVTSWVAKRPALALASQDEPQADPQPQDEEPLHDELEQEEPVVLDDVPPAAVPAPVYPVADPPLDRALGEPITSPAFLRSDRVDEEDDVRLYGPKRPWKAILGTFVALALLAGIGLAGWYWFTQRTDTTDPVALETPTAVPATDASEAATDTAAAETDPTAEPAAAAPTPEPTAVLPSYWADTVPILNSGTAEISASTYAVSPSNRAVLTGHTAAITGIVVSDDGRVLTSGADRRLVDWGADVTLANPDVLNVPSPLTVLERTADQRILAGDSVGNVTIIDLVNTVEPMVLQIHRVAVSALTELADGQLAVASVDGDVDVFVADSADRRTTLPHSVEVTAVVGLPNDIVATAAVDGVVRLWSSDGEGEPGEIATLDAPVTALTLLSNGQLAAASVQGDIHVFDAEAGAAADVVLPGHVGAVRSLFEISLPDGSTALASGGDDTTIRLWDLSTQTELQVLEGHGDIISGINALPDGRLVSTSGDGTGRVWDLSVPSGQAVRAPHDWNLSALYPWSNDQFVTGGVDGKVVLASTAITSEPLVITQHDAPIVGVTVLPSGDIVSLDAASVLRVNDSTGTASRAVELEIAAGATALSVLQTEGQTQSEDDSDDPDDDQSQGQAIVSGHADGTVRFHDLVEEGVVISAHGSGVNDVVALTSGLVVSAGQDSTVRIIDPQNPDVVPVFDLHTGPVDVVVELADGRVASAGSDGIFIFTTDGLADGHVRLNGQRSRTISLVPLPGNRLISTGEDGRVRLWDLNNPDEEPSTLVDIPGVVNPYLIQADNGLFVAGAARGYVVFTLS